MMSEETIKLNTRASSLTVAVTYNGDTVAFVGTQSGELIKVKPLNMYWERKNLRYVACLKHSDLDVGGGFIHKVEGL